MAPCPSAPVGPDASRRLAESAEVLQPWQGRIVPAEAKQQAGYDHSPEHKASMMFHVLSVTSGEPIQMMLYDLMVYGIEREVAQILLPMLGYYRTLQSASNGLAGVGG